MKKALVASVVSFGLITSIMISPAALSADRYYGAYLCGYSGFKCVRVSRGETWEHMFRNYRERELVKRLNRTNMPLKYRSWIVVPTNLKQLTELELSPFPLHKNTGGQKLLYVDLSKHAFGAYNASGILEHWGPVSGGKGYCPDIGQACATATGTFRIYRKQGEDCISSKFPVETDGGAPMPYCMHFSGGYALHGSTLPGYHASHGCVRLFFEDAKWLNQDFATIGTRVIITRS